MVASAALGVVGGCRIFPELSALQGKQLEFHLNLSFSGSLESEEWAKAGRCSGPVKRNQLLKPLAGTWAHERVIIFS